MNNIALRHSNRTVIDLHKVTYARFYYRCKEYNRDLMPTKPTVRGQDIDEKELAATHKLYPKETLLDRAKRLDIIDKWIAVCVVVMTNGHKLEFTGDKAKSIWNAWKERQFNNV